LAHRDLIQWLP